MIASIGKPKHQLQHDLIALKVLLISFFSKILNVMLIAVILIVKADWERKICSLHCHFFK